MSCFHFILFAASAVTVALLLSPLKSPRNAAKFCLVYFINLTFFSFGFIALIYMIIQYLKWKLDGSMTFRIVFYKCTLYICDSLDWKVLWGQAAKICRSLWCHLHPQTLPSHIQWQLELMTTGRLELFLPLRAKAGTRAPGGPAVTAWPWEPTLSWNQFPLTPAPGGAAMRHKQGHRHPTVGQSRATAQGRARCGGIPESSGSSPCSHSLCFPSHHHHAPHHPHRRRFLSHPHSSLHELPSCLMFNTCPEQWQPHALPAAGGLSCLLLGQMCCDLVRPPL